MQRQRQNRFLDLDLIPLEITSRERGVSVIMTKVFICGRGGSGKSTITAMFAKYLVSEGMRVLVIDADESNRSLYRMLGLLASKSTLMEDLGGRVAVKKVVFEKKDNMTAEEAKLHVDDLPLSCVSRRDNLAFLAIGKIDKPDEGCACPMGALEKGFLERLHVPGWWVLVDCEAGVEHIGRGVWHHADIFLVVLEPSHESMEMAKFMNELAIEVGRPMLTVVNMVDEDIAENVKASMKSIDIDVNAFFPRDKRIAAVNLSGESVPLLPEFMPLLRSCLDAISDKVKGGAL